MENYEDPYKSIWREHYKRLYKIDKKQYIVFGFIAGFSLMFIIAWSIFHFFYIL